MFGFLSGQNFLQSGWHIRTYYTIRCNKYDLFFSRIASSVFFLSLSYICLNCLFLTPTYLPTTGRPAWVDMQMATRLRIPHTFVLHTYTKPTKCHFCNKVSCPTMESSGGSGWVGRVSNFAWFKPYCRLITPRYTKPLRLSLAQNFLPLWGICACAREGRYMEEGW